MLGRLLEIFKGLITRRPAVSSRLDDDVIKMALSYLRRVNAAQLP